VYIDYANVLVGDAIERIIARLRQCKVLIAIIGPNWNAGRLSDERDYVRRELETAKNEGLVVIPLLVGRTTPPPRTEIPESLSFIWDLIFASLQMHDWQAGVESLKMAVDRALSS
jgi:hypothetical protein